MWYDYVVKERVGYMDNKILIQLIDAIEQLALTSLPSIFAIFLFKLSVNKDSKIKENSILEDRMKKFYIPLYQRYMRGQLPSNLKSTVNRERPPLPYDIWSELFDFLIDNIHLMGEESQNLMHDFNNQMVELMLGLAEMSIYTNSSAIKEFDNIYTNLISSLFKEYICICSQLGLPKPSIRHF